MSTKFVSELGVELTLPEGSVRVDESSAGPGTEQYSLPLGAYLSVVRDDQAAANTIQLIGWTQAMANYYVQEFGAVEELQGTVDSNGKESYAYAVKFAGAEGVPRYAVLIDALFPSGEFFGLTLLTIDLGEPFDVAMIQTLVDGLTLPTSD